MKLGDAEKESLPYEIACQSLQDNYELNFKLDL